MKNFCLIPLVVFLTLLTCHTWYGPDVWYHMTWGRDVLEHQGFLPLQRSLFEQPFVANLYWLFQTTIYLLFKWSGDRGVSIYFTAIWLAIAFIWGRVASVAKGILGGWAFLAFAICMQLRFDQRPEVYAYLLLISQVAILGTLENSAKKWRWELILLFVLEVLLANSHGYFALGPMLGGAAVASAILSRDRSRVSVAAAALAVLVVASFVTPSPLGNWQMVIGYEKIGRAMAETNVEMFPTWKIDLTWSLQVFWCYWLTVLAMAFWKSWRKQFDFSFILAVAGLILGMKMLRNIPLFVLFAAPVTAQMAQAVSEWAESGRILQARAGRFCYQTALSILACLLCVFVARGDYHRGSLSLSEFGYGLEWASYPIGATEFLRNIDFKGNVFTDSYDGGYVEFQLPQLKIAGDSYFYDPATTDAFFAAIKKPEALAAADERHHFNALLLNIENVDVVQSVWRSPAWVFAYADSHRVVFLRAGEFARYQIQTSRPGYYQGQDLRHWINAFAPITWMQTALRFGDVGLARKVLNDYEIAPVVPSTFVRASLLFAVTQQDPFVARKTLTFLPKMYMSDPNDRAPIEKLVRAVSALN